ncbi:MAG TPA: VTC domain-containing protein [Polyangiaceae bacterium]|nr:VTC domain-containing protein [Polyangiaceae bacterium]
MSSSSPATDRNAQDVAITAEREETKYLVAAEQLGALSRSINSRLEPHRFTGEAANRLPGAQHFTTTIYFDTPSLSYYSAARANMHSNVKIRAKEYYDLHPSLAELATDPEQILRYQPWLWFELKRHDGPTTTKRRFRFPKLAAATLFDENRRPEELPPAGQERSDAEALIEHVRAQPERVVPSAVVSYRRLSFQNQDGTLRVTIDLGLSFFRVPRDLFRCTRPLSKSELGTPIAQETRAVVEVKRRAALPSWLEQALSSATPEPATFSKFVAASRAIHDA